MNKGVPNLPETLQNCEQLLSQDKPWEALEELRNLLPGHFFSEDLHDLYGRCCWAMALREPKNEHVDYAGLLGGRMMEKSQAGVHWFLSSLDDEPRKKWRDLVIEENADKPEILFKALRFPEMPFDKFTSPAVRERLNTLRSQLSSRGFDDAAIHKFLAPPRKSRLVDRLALLGCAIMAICFGMILVLAGIGFIHLISK